MAQTFSENVLTLQHVLGMSLDAGDIEANKTNFLLSRNSYSSEGGLTTGKISYGDNYFAEK